MNGSTLFGIGGGLLYKLPDPNFQGHRPPQSVLTKERVETRPFYQETMYLQWNIISIIFFHFVL